MFGLLNRFLIGIEHDAHHARAENMAISLVREWWNVRTYSWSLNFTLRSAINRMSSTRLQSGLGSLGV